MLRLRLATLCRPAVLGYTRRHAARADLGGSSAWDVLGLSRSADLAAQGRLQYRPPVA